MSSPDELLAAAKIICEIAEKKESEAMYRAAINRLYFSSYHQCRNYHIGLSRPGSVGSANGKHQQLLAQLSNPDAKLPDEDRMKSVVAGKELRMILGKRVDADYNCRKEISLGDMRLSIQAADSIFANTQHPSA